MAARSLEQHLVQVGGHAKSSYALECQICCTVFMYANWHGNCMNEIKSGKCFFNGLTRSS
eukprot:344451-Prorocentrum_lima.AAC.1